MDAEPDFIISFTLLEIPMQKYGDESNFRTYMVRSGKLNVIRHIANKEVIVNTLGEGDMIGEISFFTGGKRNGTVEADSESVLYELTAQAFSDMIQENPEMAMKVMRTMAKRLNKMEKIVDSFWDLMAEIGL